MVGLMFQRSSVELLSFAPGFVNDHMLEQLEVSTHRIVN
jgi:hypothetical protein